MNFYVSIFQLIQTVENLERDFGHLAGRAFRISPRDSHANRGILEQCSAKVGEVRALMGRNAHLSKTSLRHVSLLSQIFQLCFRRMVHLAAAVPGPGQEEGNYAKAVRYLLSSAARHYGIMERRLSGLAGISLTLDLYEPPEKKAEGADLFQREESYLRETLKLLERAVEAFDEERELLESLILIRREIVEIRRKFKSFAVLPAASKAKETSPALP